MGEEGEFSNDSILYSVPHSEHWHQVRYRTRNERTLFPTQHLALSTQNSVPPPSSPLGTRNSELGTGYSFPHPLLTQHSALSTQHLEKH
uniref:Uncharacterized protein n=1 Tax=Desertifilum tharense IPPAS B-1220 TaxID=1781255 RepID=A0ACD5GYN0_9CYAN